MKYILMAAAAGLAVTLTGTARANPVTLTCTSGPNDSNPLRVTIDETAQTAAAGDDPVVTARFTDKMVEWDEVRMREYVHGTLRTVNKTYWLYRYSGELSYGAAIDADRIEDLKPYANYTLTCTIGAPQRRF